MPSRVSRRPGRTVIRSQRPAEASRRLADQGARAARDGGQSAPARAPPSVISRARKSATQGGPGRRSALAHDVLALAAEPTSMRPSAELTLRMFRTEHDLLGHFGRHSTSALGDSRNRRAWTSKRFGAR